MALHRPELLTEEAFRKRYQLAPVPEVIAKRSREVLHEARETSTGDLIGVTTHYCPDLGDGVSQSAIQEISLLRNMQHPNIVEILSFFVEGREVQTASTFMGKTLRDFVSRTFHRMNENISRSLCEQMLLGVEYCHSHGVVLRNLKPSTVFVDDTDRSRLRLRLGGFSSALKFTVPFRAALFECHAHAMTVWYTSPEILLGGMGRLLPHDMWSLGCILGEIASDKALFMGDSQIGTLFQVFKLRGTPTEQLWPGVSALPDFSKEFPQWQEKAWSSAIQAHLGADGVALLNSLLCLDPGRRLSARRALAHDWFSTANASMLKKQHATPVYNPLPLTRACSKTPFLKSFNTLSLVEGFAQASPGPLVEYLQDLDISARAEQESISACPREDFWLGGNLSWKTGLKCYRVLVDWMVEVCYKRGLGDAATFLSVSILNRYLAIKQVEKLKFQALGCAAMLIASKFAQEDDHVQRLKMMESMCADAPNCTQSGLLDMEIDVLRTIEFDLRAPTVHYFLTRFLHVGGGGQVHQLRTRYIAELTLYYPDDFQYPPSLVAAAALALSNKLSEVPACWSKVMERLTGYDMSTLEECILKLSEIKREALSCSPDTDNLPGVVQKKKPWFKAVLGQMHAIPSEVPLEAASTSKALPDVAHSPGGSLASSSPQKEKKSSKRQRRAKVTTIRWSTNLSKGSITTSMFGCSPNVRPSEAAAKGGA
jgi:serine/threonine protein kinase